MNTIQNEEMKRTLGPGAQKPTSSIRPFETVRPLALKLHMTPEMGERHPKGDEDGIGIFDAKYKKDDLEVCPFPGHKPISRTALLHMHFQIQER